MSNFLWVHISNIGILYVKILPNLRKIYKRRGQHTCTLPNIEFGIIQTKQKAIASM